MTTLPDKIPTEYRIDIIRGVEICKTEGCNQVYIFGSVAVSVPTPSLGP